MRSAIDRKLCAASRLRTISTRCLSRMALVVPPFIGCCRVSATGPAHCQSSSIKFAHCSAKSRKNIDAHRSFAYGLMKIARHREERPMGGDHLRFDAPLPDLWDDERAASLDDPGLLLYRSNLLGSDLRITNFGGGNTSAKL